MFENVLVTDFFWWESTEDLVEVPIPDVVPLFHISEPRFYGISQAEGDRCFPDISDPEFMDIIITYKGVP